MRSPFRTSAGDPTQDGPRLNLHPARLGPHLLVQQKHPTQRLDSRHELDGLLERFQHLVVSRARSWAKIRPFPAWRCSVMSSIVSAPTATPGVSEITSSPALAPYVGGHQQVLIGQVSQPRGLADAGTGSEPASGTRSRSSRPPMSLAGCENDALRDVLVFGQIVARRTSVLPRHKGILALRHAQSIDIVGGSGVGLRASRRLFVPGSTRRLIGRFRGRDGASCRSLQIPTLFTASGICLRSWSNGNEETTVMTMSSGDGVELREALEYLLLTSPGQTARHLASRLQAEGFDSRQEPTQLNSLSLLGNISE